MDVLLSTLLLAFAIQAAFFAYAAWRQTDTVTDLSYALTFIILAWHAYAVTGHGLALAIAVTLWGVRLGAYLFVRILHMRRDTRFDGIREHPWRFAKFWTLQALATWLILTPVTAAMRDGGSIALPGLAVWAIGLAIETVADWQKYAFKRRHPDKMMQSGLFKHGRHPNYFGELLCWWGLFLAALPTLSSWSYLTALGPVLLTVLLLFVTGIPTIEKAQHERYGREYEAYRKRTRLFV